jgi:hypothetical protein
MQYIPPLDHIMVTEIAAYAENLQYGCFIRFLSSLPHSDPPPPNQKNLIPEAALLEVAYH